MAGKTVSAYVGPEIVRRVEHAARVEARPVSQIASAALAFYARLPSEAHHALRVIEALGGTAALDQVARTVARQIVDAEYELAERRAAEAIPEAIVAGLGADDDLLAAAVRLTAPSRPNSAG